VARESPEARLAPVHADRRTGIQVLARAANVLRCLAESNEGLTLAQIASRVGVARSTVHRIVVALEEEAWVRSTPTGYRPGPGLLALMPRAGVVGADLRPFLVELSRELNETVDLSVLTGHTMTFIDQVVAPRLLRTVSAIGRSFPIHCTANGKVVLANHDEDAVRALLPTSLPRLTSSTITDLETLKQELELVRRSGVALDREEHTIGICAVGCALVAADGGWFAISVPVPAQRFYGQEERLAAALLRCREDVLAAGHYVMPHSGA